MDGWIKLHRKIIKNPIWHKTNYVAIWIYILLHANHQNKSIIWNNKKVTIEKGAFVGSIKQIADYYGLSTGTVSYILDYFISENMVEKRSNKRFTYFKVKNWHRYQMVENKTENKLKTNEKQIETNKKDKNDKNVKKKTLWSYQQFVDYSSSKGYDDIGYKIEWDKMNNWVEQNKMPKNIKNFWLNWIKKSPKDPDAERSIKQKYIKGGLLNKSYYDKFNA